MRIFKTLLKGAALVALSATVLGCVDTQPTVGGPTPIPKSVTVTAGRTDVVIAAPSGFCIDRATIDENLTGAFMLGGDCQVIDSAGTTARLPISAVLTASLSGSGLAGSELGLKPALTTLESFLKSEAGLFTLGKSHVEGAVSILNTKHTASALYILVQDTATTNEAGASNRFWRAFTEVNGRLLVMSVTGYHSTDTTEARSLAIIRAFVQTTLDANPVVVEQP